jgi:hypothetical protein
MKSVKWICSWILPCTLFLLFSFGALAQQPPSTRPAQSSDLELVKFLREEARAHREYLEKLYTITISVMGILVAFGGLGFALLGYKSRKDVEDAVNAQFQKTVRREINSRVDRSMDEVRIQVHQHVEDLLKAVDAIYATAPQGTEGIEAKSPPTLNKQEQEILRLMRQSSYSFRSLVGISADAERNKLEKAKVPAILESLTQKGLVGKTLGKSGGERWYLTAQGRMHPLPQHA